MSKVQPKVKIFTHRTPVRDAQYPNYNAWADAARSKGYEIVELYDDSPNEIAGTGPWGAFKNNQRMGVFENGRGGTLDRAMDAPSRATNQRVKIIGGMREFVGKVGTIVGKEGSQYRVRFDTPVNIPGVGEVEDDLWDGNMLKQTNDAASRIKVYNHGGKTRDFSVNYGKNLTFVLDKAKAMGASCSDETRSELKRKIDDWFEPDERKEVMTRCMQAAIQAFAVRG